MSTRAPHRGTLDSRAPDSRAPDSRAPDSRTPHSRTPHSRTPHSKTLWEEGRHPGPLVALLAVVTALLVVLVDVAVFGHLTMLFDVCFVLVCVAAALSVRPRDFFVAGVLPPLLLATTVLVLALVARDVVARPTDGIVQAMVSGLAHRAGALAVGYALALLVLALRQVAMRHSGTIRRSAAAQRSSPRQTLQHTPASGPAGSAADRAAGPNDRAATGAGQVPEQRRPSARSVR